MKLRRLRDGDVLENGDIVPVRGGDLDPDILRVDHSLSEGNEVEVCRLWP